MLVIIRGKYAASGAVQSLSGLARRGNSQRGIEINLAIGISGDDLAQPAASPLRCQLPGRLIRRTAGIFVGSPPDQTRCNAAQMFELDKLGPVVDLDNLTPVSSVSVSDAGRSTQSPMQMNFILRLPASIGPDPRTALLRSRSAE